MNAVTSPDQYRRLYGDGRRHEQKSIIQLTDEMAAWAGVSRQDGTNFRTNTVSLAEYQDSGGGTGLGLSAVFACVRLLAGTIASLPLVVYRTDQSGKRTVALDHPLHRVFKDSPNADQTPLDFWEFVCVSLELHGNAYCEIARGNDGRVIALSPPISPEAMSVRRLDNGDLEYRWAEDGRQRTETQATILHIRGFGGGPLGGISTLACARQTLGLAGAINRAASATFRNGIRPSGVMSAERDLSEEQLAAMQARVEEKFVGALNAGRPLILNRDLKWQSISINPEDAQMLESRGFSIEEICRFFSTPPPMIGHTSKTTSWPTGLEQQMRMFYTLALRSRLERIEQWLKKSLLTPRDRVEGIEIEFKFEGLLRSESESRAKFHESALKNKWRTINEVRALENEPPVPWGDRPWGQMQDVQLDENGDISGRAPPAAAA